MLRNLKYPIMAFILLMVLPNCKKDAGFTDLYPLMCRGGWKIIDAKLAGSGMQVLTDSCIRDNTLGLSPTDGRMMPYGSMNYGDILCDSTESSNGNWHWNVDNEKYIFIPGIFIFPGQTNITCYILELTEDKLVISTEMLYNGVKQKVTVTYTH
jgi:hypothetical protein